MINEVFSALIAYLLGATPSAFLIVRHFAKKDIRKEGSGNVGAMNSYETTGNKFIGLYVLMLDMAKGMLAVYIAKIISNNDFFAISLAAVFAVLGHNFSIYLKFKGGRGLACALGALCLINPYPGVLWILMWLFTKSLISKNVHVQNAVATLTMPLLLFLTPSDFLRITNIDQYFDKTEFILLVVNIAIVILIGHFQPLKEMIIEYRNRKD